MGAAESTQAGAAAVAVGPGPPANGAAGNSRLTPASDAGNSPLCYMCLETDVASNLLMPCGCRGSVAYVHAACLKGWKASLSLGDTRRTVCAICHHEYRLSGIADLWLYCGNAVARAVARAWHRAAVQQVLSLFVRVPLLPLPPWEMSLAWAVMLAVARAKNRPMVPGRWVVHEIACFVAEGALDAFCGAALRRTGLAQPLAPWWTWGQSPATAQP